MIKIGICDDEKIVLSVLGTLVKQSLEELEEGGKIINFHSGEELLEEVEKLDVLFLDIEMPGLDGIEVGSQIQKRNLDCKVIMATSRQDRFKEAFKINAFRFITKPFQKK
ncbi:MAG: response regulator [Clostridiales bacterium]|nr:response regulator [Clostridiales bacterium]